MVTPGGERVKTLYKKGEGCEKKNKQTNKQTNKTKQILYQFSHANIFVQNGPLRELKVLPRNAVSRYKCNCNK